MTGYGNRGYQPKLIAGVDEAGRGPLAGPVIAAAVILDPGRPIEGLADSKVLTARRREELAELIRINALAFATGRAEVEEIDSINILQATMLAMQRAVAGLKPEAGHVLVDGNRCPEFSCTAESIVKGDSSIPAISAASILAKVKRDREMIEMEATYPGYGLARHKGYPSREHIEALQRLGVTPIHRRSYGPVKKLLECRKV